MSHDDYNLNIFHYNIIAFVFAVCTSLDYRAEYHRSTGVPAVRRMAFIMWYSEINPDSNGFLSVAIDRFPPAA